MELRTETTEKDALDVIEILQYTFEDKITNCQSLSTKNVTNGRVSKLMWIYNDRKLYNSNMYFLFKG